MNSDLNQSYVINAKREHSTTKEPVRPDTEQVASNRQHVYDQPPVHEGSSLPPEEPPTRSPQVPGSQPPTATNRFVRAPPCHFAPDEPSSHANSRVQPFVSVPVLHPLRRLRPFGCPGFDDSPGQAPLTPPSPPKVSASRRMEGGGGHAPPRSARLRGPPPPFSRATSTSARFARRPISWNAPLSLRYGALTRRQANVSRSASGAQEQTRAYTRSGQNGPRDTRRPRPKDRPPRAVGCARPSLTSSLGRGKPPRQLTALVWPSRAPDSPAFLALQLAPFRRRRTRPKTRKTVAPGYCSIPLPSATGNRRDRRGPWPAHHQSWLRKRSQARWPPLRPGHAPSPNSSLASGWSGQLVLPPSLLSLTIQKPEHRDPAPHDKKPKTMPDMYPWRRESGQLLLRLRCSFLRVWASAELAALTTAPNVSLTSSRPCSTLGLTARPSTIEPRPGAAHSRPEVRNRGPRDPPHPRAPDRTSLRSGLS